MFDPDYLNVWQPSTVVAFVRETHALSVTWLFAADLAAVRHGKTPGCGRRPFLGRVADQHLDGRMKLAREAVTTLAALPIKSHSNGTVSWWPR